MENIFTSKSVVNRKFKRWWFETDTNMWWGYTRNSDPNPLSDVDI
jgi:hypothetical protein